MATVEFKIQVMSDGSIELIDADDNVLEEILDPKSLIGFLNDPINDALVTPMFTYIKTNSGVIIINGRAYRVP